jgi:hypothetical protein
MKTLENIATKHEAASLGERLKMTNQYYFTVAVETGNTSMDYRSHEQRCTCGHKHKTREAAEKCQEKLTRRDKSGNCSALWYNSRIHNQDSERA